MSSEPEEANQIAQLKGKVYVIANAGEQADTYTKSTKAIGEYVGRVYGREMKKLVLQLTECGPLEPTYPSEGDEKAKAIWSKEYDHYLKKQEQYRDQKAKVFTIILGQCTKPMRNRVEGTTGYGDVEKDTDVVGLLRMVKDVAFDSNDRKYPHLQAARAWKQLSMIRQQDNEDLVDYYKRFWSVVEMVERSYGKIVPVEIASREARYSADKDTIDARERDRFLAFMFMDGADKTVYGYLMRDLSGDYALGNENYPDTVEDALQVLALRTGTKGSKDRKHKTGGETSFAQTGTSKRKLKCWKCQKEGHMKKDCPEDDGSESDHSVNSYRHRSSVLWPD